MMMKRHLLSAAAAIAASGALCAAALAATPYSVKLKVPTSVKPGHSFKVTASGTSASTSRLTVFLSKSCASTAKAESGSAKAIINKNVTHSYTTSKKATASGKTGTYHACAYLTTGSTTRAHASAKYFVTIGGY
jgi:hypothetical protein